MTNKFSLFSKLGKDRLTRSAGFLARLLRDEEGIFLVYVALGMPVFIGLAALATEGALIFYNHRNVSSAADAAAYSAAIAYSMDNSISRTDLTTQAQAIVANYGLAIGTGNGQANVVVGWPPNTTTYSDTTSTP